MANNPLSTWPYLRLTLPEAADSEQLGTVVQAAADAGALGGSSEVGDLLLYLPQEADEALLQTIRQAVASEAEALGWTPLTWKLEALADQPWATAWKKDFITMPVGHRLLVRPDWEVQAPAPPEWSNRLTIWLRPGFGFGTGRHETTRLALEMLESHLEEGTRVLDFGSGSGILSIAAVRLGACSVTAIEFDPDANQNARENFDLNHSHARIYLHEANHPGAIPGSFDLIICNMLPQNALQHFEALAMRLEGRQSVFIYSGFLVDQKLEIETALAQVGLMTQGFAQLNEWGAVVAVRVHTR